MPSHGTLVASLLAVAVSDVLSAKLYSQDVRGIAQPASMLARDIRGIVQPSNLQEGQEPLSPYQDQVKKDQHNKEAGVAASQAFMTAGAADEASDGAPARGWTPSFRAPQLTPVEFLIISSRTQGKIVYTELKNFKSTYGRTFALVDSGLKEPCGLALDRERGHLYIADKGALSIYRYNVEVQEDTNSEGKKTYALSTGGGRITILTGRAVEWISINALGDLFYTDPVLNSVNKIPQATLADLAQGDVQASMLQTVSEKSLEAQSSAEVAASLTPGQAPTEEPAEPATSNQVLALYEGKMNSFVSKPAGVVADGLRLYWVNSADAGTKGAAIQGEVNPKSPLGLGVGGQPAQFPTKALATIQTNNSVQYGMAKSNNMVFFGSQEQTIYGEQGTIFGVVQDGGQPLRVVRGMGTPRGMIWDGDNTVFVADEALNSVYSFPAGRPISDAPITKAVEFAGAYGVALMSEEDEAFKSSRSWAARGAGSALLSAVTVAWALLHGSYGL